MPYPAPPNWVGDTGGNVWTDGIVKVSTPPRSLHLPRADAISIAEIEKILSGRSIFNAKTGLIAEADGIGSASFQIIIPNFHKLDD